MKRFRFFIIFSLIGVLCVFIDYFFYLLFLKPIGIAFVAKILSSIISVSANYFLNTMFNFNNKQSAKIKFYISYILLYSILIFINACVNSLFIQITDNIKLSFWLAAVIAAFTNYFSVKIFFTQINKKTKDSLLSI